MREKSVVDRSDQSVRAKDVNDTPSQTTMPPRLFIKPTRIQVFEALYIDDVGEASSESTIVSLPHPKTRTHTIPNRGLTARYIDAIPRSIGATPFNNTNINTTHKALPLRRADNRIRSPI